MPRRNTDDLTDAQLVERCRSGDAGAWESLVRRYGRLVYAIPCNYGLTPTECEDVFQAVWLGLIQHLQTLRQPERLSAWLVTTARRASWDRRRRADFRLSLGVDPDPWLAASVGDEPLPEEYLEELEQFQALAHALNRLDARCRRLLRLLFLDRDTPSYDDIAHQMAVPVGAIGPTRARCLRKLRALLR